LFAEEENASALKMNKKIEIREIILRVREN
jgi:hypothetical protein